MGILLREAMRIFPFSEAKLLGGAGGLDRMVESANIQEVPNVERWLHGGEILFSAGFAFQNEERGVSLMEQINTLGAAAIALKPGQYLPRIPEGMIACADRLQLPLFEMPTELPYMDCIIPIFERITETQLSLLRRVETIHQRLMQSILREEGLDGICATLNQVTGRPVFLLSPKGNSVLAGCTGRECQEYIATIQEQFQLYAAQRGVGSFRRNLCNQLRFASGQEAVCVPIFVQEGHIAYLLLDSSDCQLPDMDLIAFEHASSLIAIELLKEQALIEKEQKVREKLLEDVLMKRYTDERMVFRRGLSVGMDLEKPYCIFVIDPDSFEHYVRQELSHVSEPEIQQIKSRIHEIIRSGMQEFRGPQLLMNNSVSVVGMVSVMEADDLRNCRSVVENIIQRLKQTFPKLGFSGGLGRTKKHIREADVALREAKLALDCGRLRQFRKKSFTAAFEELGALSFLSELADSQTMREYYLEHMGGLLSYDAEHGAELLATLESYFQCNQNLRLTSERLFIHKNSVIYRIKKVELLIGAPLSDGQVAFDLQLCLLLRNIF